MELEYIDNNRQYENYKKDIVTKIAYLIGVKDSIIKTNRFEQNIISSLEENEIEFVVSTSEDTIFIHGSLSVMDLNTY